MKGMSATKNTRLVIFLFVLPLLFTTNAALGQTESNKFDFYLKGTLGSLFNKNAQQSQLDPKMTTCFGMHLTGKYSFSKLGVSAGIGADRLKFAQEVIFTDHADGREYSTVEFSYVGWGIPILVHYSIADRFEVYGGVQLMAARWNSYGISTLSKRTSELTAETDEDIPDWQFTQEVMAGVNYNVSERFGIGISIAKSLKNIDGMGLKMEVSVPDQDDIHISEKFDYSWTRINLELAFRLNK